MIWGCDYKDFVHVKQNLDTSTNSPSLSKGCFSTRKTEMFQTFHKYNENNTIKHQTFRFKQCRIVLLRPLKCREEKTPSPTYDYPMGDKIGKKDGPTFWAKRRGFSHSDYISAGFELLDFEPKSKDNSWSYVQIFHSVYTKERKKVVWQWERAAQLMFGDAICPCCIGETRARAWRLSTMSFPSTTTRKHDSAKVERMVLIFQINHKVLLLFPF